MIGVSALRKRVTIVPSSALNMKSILGLII